MDLSIIVPVYQVEKYIQACIESIYNQGLEDDRFEVIIVNDGSTDKSIELIQDIVCRHTNLHIITQENQGVAVARNNGIARASGDYVLFMDSDDLLVDNSIYELLKIAIDKRADLVVADFLKLKDNEIAQFSGVKRNSFIYEEKTGEQLFIEDLNPNECYVWRTLFRRDFLIKEHIVFSPISICEDTLFVHEAYMKAEKCIRTEWVLYIYRIGHRSITSSFDKNKLKDICYAIGKTWRLGANKAISVKMQSKLEDDVYASFSFLFYAMLHSIRNSQDRKEILYCLLENAPQMEFKNSLKRRLVSSLLKKAPRFYLRIREYHWWWITRRK